MIIFHTDGKLEIQMTPGEAESLREQIDVATSRLSDTELGLTFPTLSFLLDNLPS